MLGRLLNMAHLCLMLNLFGTSEISGTKTKEIEGFLNWMFFEMTMIISTVFVTILFLLIRLFDRGSIDVPDEYTPD